jgi:fimbrial isopeptide formation D2 family protein
LAHLLCRVAIGRLIFLCATALCAFALIIGSSPALAQTQMVNTARIGLSSGIADSDPSNDQSQAVVNVTPLPVVTYAKSVNAPDPAVSVGDTLTYTLTATVTNSATLNVLTLTDTLGPGLDFGAVTNVGAFTCNAANPLVCTLPAGTAAGTYSLTYTATVNATATTFVSNAVVGTGDDNPTCAGACDTDTPVADATVAFAKTTGATSVAIGDTISYTLSATVANSQTTGIVTLTDTLGAGLNFGTVVSAGIFTCNAANPLVCTLPAGTAPGSYSLTYTAIVNASASGSVTNAVIGSGPDDPSCAINCGTDTPLVPPGVTYSKSVSAPGATVSVGNVLTYTPANW